MDKNIRSLPKVSNAVHSVSEQNSELRPATSH